MYETHIILIPVSKMSDGRKVVERIENEKFDSREAVENAICFDEDDPIAVEDIGIMEMADFMDYCNNTDDDTPKDLVIDISENWVGYVQIKK